MWPESLTHPGCELPSPVWWRRVPPGYPTLPFRLYLSDSESWSPIGRRRELPGQASLPFPPHGRRGLPIQTASIFLRSDVGESLLATQLAFLSLPVQHSESWSPVGRLCELPSQTTLPFKPVAQRGSAVRHGDSETSRTSARASGTNNLTFSNLLLDQAYPSDTAILKPVGRRREPPGQTTLPFQTYCSTRLTRPTRRFWNQSDVGESLRDRQFSFSILRPARPTQPRCRLTGRPSDPLNFAFLSKPIRLCEPRSPDGRRREHSRPDNLIFSSPRSTRLTRPTRRFWHHSQTSARASQPDNLTFPSPELGKVYPSDTAIAEATVGRRREPPSQTILPFKVPCSARLTRPARQLLKPQSDVGKSLPARQTHPFRLLAPRYRTPSNPTCPAV